jgi:hypothetical protein
VYADDTDAMPTTVWVWDLHKLKLVALLVQRQPVRGLRWMPSATADASTGASGYGGGPATTVQGVGASPTRPGLGAAAAFAPAPLLDDRAQLAVWTESPYLFLWQPAGATVLPLPFETAFDVAAVLWQPRGAPAVLVADRGANAPSAPRPGALAVAMLVASS